MGRIYFKRPIDVPTVDSYSSNIESTAGFRAYGGGMVDVVLTSAATGTSITNYGHSYINSTAAKTFNLAAPAAGCFKVIGMRKTSTGTKVRASTGGARDIITTGGAKEVLNFTAAGGYAVLVGLNSSQYFMLANNSVTMSTA